MRPLRRLLPVAVAVAALGAAACDAPSTSVVLEDRYPSATDGAQVVYRARWHAIAFDTPLLPGSSSEPQSTVAASATVAWVLLAPGFDPSLDGGVSDALIVLQSRDGFAVHLNETLHIPVDDTAFAGRCLAGSFLSQEQADFITGRVFASEFAGRRYDAATCATTGGP